MYYNFDTHPDARAAFDLGYRGYPAFRLDRKEHRSGVMDVFLRRLPPRSRSDFADYLVAFRLQAVPQLSDTALLGYSGAKLPSDGFTFVHPFDGATGPCELMLEVSGFRKYVRSDFQIELKQAVEFQPEPTNLHDPAAIAIRYRDITIGYVNRLQTAAFHTWIRQARLSAVVEKINGQIDRPRAYIFVRVEPLRDEKVA